ncbi:MAG: protein-L-isoaspartate(D-aspartate) O-methyltransferase [Alcaligenaceae bacterium]|jgi:protein-L-isoaspartate(D-aspartate) O-methyltransferase|nr:protein-L-isoaspartate(D-aspartate) O-methyltransferase [Alcaligenaceae bacterium]
MRKPLTHSPFGTGTVNRFGRSSLGNGITVSNSNARVAAPGTSARKMSPAGPAAVMSQGPSANLGLNSDRLRAQMVQRLRTQGITDERVLAAMMAVPRHLFVDEGLASRAYEDAALPIGYGQTISQPWVVARMIAAVCEQRMPVRVLEVGAGCGYQAAVLSQLVPEVYAIERIRGLHDLARGHLRVLKTGSRVRLSFADGMLGLPAHAPYDAIVVAAAGIKIPQALLDQLAVGGRLIAPEGSADQRLILIERTGLSSFSRTDLESVRFVPLRAGTQL